jgi:hypothetical protein
VLAGAAAIVCTVASPAGAHTLGGVDATNYRTDIVSVTASVPGLTIRAIEGGDRLELENQGRHDVIVEGYDGEPYLRVGPRGAFENVRSPARFLNRVRRDAAPPPASADPDAAPRWRAIASGRTVRWHDHRAHWMGSTDPPVVARDPDVPHVIQRFTIPLRTSGGDVRVHGLVRWVPGSSPWPWVAGAGVLTLAILGLARTRRAPAAIAGGLGIALAAAGVHTAGTWSLTAGSLGGRLGAVLPTLGAAVLAIGACVRLWRAGLRGAAPLLVFAGLFLAIAIGLADVSALAKSQLPTDLPTAVDRSSIGVVLGAGFGVALGSAFFVADVARPAASA